MKESAIQTYLIRYLRMKCRGIVIVANPFSELQFQGSREWKWKALGNAKAQGWEKSQADLTIYWNNRTYFVELKTERENPFRPFRGLKRLGSWFDNSKGEKREHVLAQAVWLSTARRQGSSFAGFVSGMEQGYAIAEMIATGVNATEKFMVDSHSFSAGKYIPEPQTVDFLNRI